MNIKQWCMEHIANFAESVKTEEDMEIKVLLPFLQELGYLEPGAGIFEVICGKSKTFRQRC